jgi:hypothetical protein
MLNLDRRQFADLLNTDERKINILEHGGVQDKSMNELIRLKMNEYRQKRKCLNAGFSKSQHYALIPLQSGTSLSKNANEVNGNVNGCDSNEESQSITLACGC